MQENENYLVQDSMLFQASRKNEQFLKDLQIIHDTIGFDKTWIYQEMKFDNLYEKGKLENLQVREAVAVSEWENPYITR